MTLQIYNTTSKEKEEFQPIDEHTVTMYVCGQTVYDNMHIGHARTYVAFDIVKRYLEFKGYAVKTVINITDVNDKINNRAEEESRDPWEVAEEYSEINLEDFEALGVHADAYPKASDYVQEMIGLVQTLEEKGIAYEVDGDVFFDVRAFEEYGKLSHQNLEDIRPEREDDIVASEKKRNAEDFVLWKSREGGEYSPTWESPWGEGIPGWHIECSAMSMELLGDQFDIHGGGSDLVFPHHEDEIAQSQAATDEEWVNYWMHSGLVRMKEEKMSKSLGNFVSTRKLLEEHDPRAIRLMIAGTHYRKPLDYDQKKIEDAEKNLESLENTVKDLQAELREVEKVPERLMDEDVDTLEQVFKHRAKFVEAMDDDFNTPEALKHFYELESIANTYLSKAPKRPVLERLLYTLQELGEIIGVLEQTEAQESAVDDLMKQLLTLREKLRADEKYDLADQLRDTIEAAGIKVEDTGSGARWKKQ